MDVWVRAIVIILGSILGSGGLWAYLQGRDRQKNAITRLTMGLAYAQLTALGLEYIERGSITKDEFEDYRKYFFEPYKALGGNGVAERIMRDVSNLPFRPHDNHIEIFRNEERGWVNNVRVVSRTRQEAASE